MYDMDRMMKLRTIQEHEARKRMCCHSLGMKAKPDNFAENVQGVAMKTEMSTPMGTITMHRGTSEELEVTDKVENKRGLDDVESKEGRKRLKKVKL